MAKLLAVKPLSRLLKEAENEGESGLKRTLGPLNLITLGIGAIIGAGIFVLTGQAAANHAGPGVVLSFIVAGITCAFAGLCYAEFASMIPIAGSAYTYGYATLGEFVAWIIGWDLILEYLFGASTVAVGWSGDFVKLMAMFNIHIPPGWSGAPFDVIGTHTLVRTTICTDPVTHAFTTVTTGVCSAGQIMSHGMMNVPAIFLIGLMTALLVIGIKESASFNNLIVILKLSIVLL